MRDVQWDPAPNPNPIIGSSKKKIIKVIGTPRPGKKLVVVSMDQTIFDANASLDIYAGRPYFQEFFSKVYEFYDIALWSSKAMNALEQEIVLLGMNKYPDYKLLCWLDKRALMPTSSYDITFWVSEQ